MPLTNEQSTRFHIALLGMYRDGMFAVQVPSDADLANIIWWCLHGSADGQFITRKTGE